MLILIMYGFLGHIFSQCLASEVLYNKYSILTDSAGTGGTVG